MDNLKKETTKDYTAWDLNCKFVCMKNRQKLEAIFKRKARRKIKELLRREKKMTINEQLRRLRPHIEEDDTTELFICADDWANTAEGTLYAECHDIEEFDSFLKQYGKLKCIDWCAIVSHYDGLGIGFVVASADL